LAQEKKSRARDVISKLNKVRHAQAKQIDILCNDMVSAHSDFVNQLQDLNFTNRFFESLLGLNDMGSILENAVNTSAQLLNNSSAAVWLKKPEKFEIHFQNQSGTSNPDKEQLEACFSPEICKKICESNSVCSEDILLEMGFDSEQELLNRNTFAAAPVGKMGASAGFILVYRDAEYPFKKDELRRLASICPALSKALSRFLPSTADTAVSASGEKDTI
jgi:hypothetical protein